MHSFLGMRSNTPAAPARAPDVSWHDHLVMLLHLAAEIEHVLMVQYLYAGYSIDSRNVHDERKAMVEGWRQSILDIAKEEMGHLLSVQNILMLLGAPTNLNRRNFPWDKDYYPFPFRLEPLSLDSLSLYVFAEMPSDEELEKERQKGDLAEWHYREFLDPKVYEPFKARVEELTGGTAHHVDELYNEIIALIADEEKIPDHLFREASVAYQASWDDWGRRYRPTPRLLTPDGSIDPDAPYDPAGAKRTSVLVIPVATRTQALAALQLISEQGEAPHLGADKLAEDSHFDRFLKMYLGMLKNPDLLATLDVATDPTTREMGRQESFISNEATRDWAALANLRYRMLLAYLAHALRAAHGSGQGAPQLRAMLMHKVFGEMYNLKALSVRLVHMDRTDDPDARPAKAGPPFEVPYDLNIPAEEADVWRLHLELLRASEDLVAKIRDAGAGDGEAYLASLLGLDAQSCAWIEKILAGLLPGQRV